MIAVMPQRMMHIIAASAAFMLAGCVTIRYGSPPKTDRLESLKLGVSSKAEVQSVLGAPRGNGMLRHSANTLQYVQKFTADPGKPMGLDMPIDSDPTRRTMWFYEYSEASGRNVDLKFLLIFFLGEHYDGHLWFSASNVLERQ
jgi:hypothetical protein